MKEKLKLLVVDDEDIVRESLSDWLSSIGYKVLTAKCGEEALRIIKQKKVKIMIADLIMPGMNGIEATKAICKEYKQAKILMLTQYDNEENIFASNRAGAIGFIPKKSASSHLIAGIRSASRGENFTVAMG